MWHKLIPDLFSLWFRLWPYVLSGMVGSCLTAGFLYLLKRRDERREFKKKLTVELYSPARRQFAEAVEAIQKGERAFSINTDMWKQACSSGITRKLKPLLRSKLAALYEHTLPSYDKAWQVLNEEIGRIAGEWDRRYADITDFQVAAREHHIVEIKWWNFLTANGPVTPIDGLRDGDVLRLWNCFMTPERFKVMDRSPEQFLTERWHEAERNDAVKQFQALRERALEDIPRAIALLDRSSLY
jgi:hypothetical protein